MYTLFSADFVSYENREIIAYVKKEPQEYTDLIANGLWRFDKCDFCPKKISSPFEFYINQSSPFIDNYRSSAGYSLYSQKLLDILSNFGVKFETFEVTLFDENSKQKVYILYRAFHLLQCAVCIDEERSITRPNPIMPMEKDIVKIALRDDFLKTKHLLARDSKHPEFVFIHDDLKKVLNQQDITGCHYRDINLPQDYLF